jgi:serine protease Do
VAQDDDPPERPAWIRYGIPIVIVVVALIGWRMRYRTDPEPAKPRAAQQVASSDDAAGDANAPNAAGANPSASSSSSSNAPPPRGPRNAKQVFQETNKGIVRVALVDGFGNPRRQGSGVVVARGEVVTNCHVVEGEGAVEIKIGLESYPATVTIADKPMDLCRLSAAGLDVPPVTVYGSMDLEPGERVFAIGSPRGLELTISEGIVSSLRELEGGNRVIQTTAPVSPGSSGGGLFDNQARLVGIITFQRGDGQNLNFALPAEWIAEMRNRD